MSSIAFQSGHLTAFSSGAVQHKRISKVPNAALAKSDCGATDTAEAFVARGFVYGLLISAPLWLIITGAIYLACHTMG